MKKILSVMLAVMMLFGVFAISLTATPKEAEASGPCYLKVKYYIIKDGKTTFYVDKESSGVTPGTSVTITPPTHPTYDGYTRVQSWGTVTKTLTTTGYTTETQYCKYEKITNTFKLVVNYKIQYYGGSKDGQTESVTSANASNTSSATSAAITVYSPSAPPARSGYTFGGGTWTTKGQATTETVSTSNTQQGANLYVKTVTLYANYYPAATPTPTASPTPTPHPDCWWGLYFDANGGSGVPENQFRKQNDALDQTFTVPSTKPTRSGYIFKEWNLNKEGTGSSVQPGGSVYMSRKDYSVTSVARTLYAIWTDVATLEHTFTLNYDANGGSGAPAKQEQKKTGTEYEFTISSSTPTKSGMVFNGWNTKADGSGTKYSKGGKITVKASGNNLTASTTLYAQWKTAPTPTPTATPTVRPTATPTVKPTATPTQRPTTAPTAAPTQRPTSAPTQKPTAVPTQKPTQRPSSGPVQPTQNPSNPTSQPTQSPIETPDVTKPEDVFVLDVITPDTESGIVKLDGLNVIIYNSVNEMVFTEEEHSYLDLFSDEQRTSLVATKAWVNRDSIEVAKDTAILTAELVNEKSNTYAFHTENGKYLYCNGVDVKFVDRDNDNRNFTLFVIEKQDNDCFYIKSKAATSKQYLECNNDGFTSSDLIEGNGNYLMKFLKIHEDAQVVVETPEPVIEVKNLSVKAVDENGIPLKNVRIALYNSLDSAIYADYSENNGIVTFESIEYGEYSVKVIGVPEGYAIPEEASESIVIDASFDENVPVVFKIAVNTVEATPEPSEEPTPEPVPDVTATPEPVTTPSNNGSNPVNWTLIALIGGGALLVLGAVLIIVLANKKKKSNNKEYDDEDEYDEE